jgi:acetylornithine/succinyldiaminopimelate/putrescine aminotransferase/predicted amino acid dehydrogenase
MDPIENKRREVERFLKDRVARGGRGQRHSFERFVNPYVAELIAAFNLDKRYVRGEGCRVFDDTGRGYLDFTAAYGALPFGFNPPEIWRAIDRVRDLAQPSFVQPSLIEGAGQLAERLIRIAPRGLRYVAFSSTGAEAVEVAIKLARAKTGKPGIVSTHNAFHGKTLGALSATGKPRYQTAFFAPLPEFTHIPYGDAAALDELLAANESKIAAFIVEPLQGEGGIVAPPLGYLSDVRAICDRHGVLLIVDEIQSGLGRVGSLFACNDEGVTPDIMTIAKALSGGLVPIAATLYTEPVYTREFAAQHTSTFANNGLACAVGQASLELITRDDNALVRHVHECGNYLRQRLRELAVRHPQVVREIRGRGFFLGIELTESARDLGYQGILSSLAEQGTLGFAICSYLLNIEQIRLAPTLFATQVLRIEPPLVATPAMCDELVAAMGRAIGFVAAGDTLGLLGHLFDADPETLVKPKPRLTEVVTPRPGELRFGFIVHPVDAESFADFDPALKAVKSLQVEKLRQRLVRTRLDGMPNALVMGTCRVQSALPNTTIYGEFIAVPHTAAELLELPTTEAVNVIREAVELARDRGAQVVGLGAYTSIVTRNAEYLDGVNVPLTTGNAYTAVSATLCVEQLLRERGDSVAAPTVAVIGAAGAIGRAVAHSLMSSAGKLVLLGNPENAASNLAQMREMGRQMARHVAQHSAAGQVYRMGSFAHALAQELSRPECTHDEAVDALIAAHKLVISVDRETFVPLADIIVTATSCPRGLLSARSVKQNAIICDVSQPSNVTPELLQKRPDVEVIDGGIIELPGGAELGVELGLGHGLTYACMAETMLICFEGQFAQGSIGNQLSVELVERVRGFGERHGFSVKRKVLARASSHAASSFDS